MFYDFLIKYIKDYIEDSINEYEITDNDIEDIAEDVSNNDYVWECLEEAIDQQLDKYRNYEEE